MFQCANSSCHVCYMAVMKFVVYRRVGWSGVEWRCDNDITPSTLTPQQVYPVPFIEWCKLGTGRWEGARPADMQRRLISLLSFGMEVKLPYGTTWLSLSPSSYKNFKEIDRLLRNLAPVLCRLTTPQCHLTTPQCHLKSRF
jgi:hypothetical protein